jgi:hypothetical protein
MEVFNVHLCCIGRCCCGAGYYGIGLACVVVLQSAILSVLLSFCCSHFVLGYFTV